MIQKLFIVFLFFTLSGFSSGHFVRSEFYNVFQEGSISEIEKFIIEIESKDDLNGYTGALYLKLSGLQKEGSKKLSSFKKGRVLLDSTIEKEPGNTELRFLRIVIQEHVPPILKYNKEIKEDKALVIEGYSSCDSQLKKIIKGYSDKSKVLQPFDFQ